jgi:hypothetical protein
VAKRSYRFQSKALSRILGRYFRPKRAGAPHRFDQPPALTWLELEAMGGQPPSNRLEAEALAAEVRKWITLTLNGMRDTYRKDLILRR